MLSDIADPKKNILTQLYSSYGIKFKVFLFSVGKTWDQYYFFLPSVGSFALCLIEVILSKFLH